MGSKYTQVVPPNSKCFTYCIASVVLSLVPQAPLGGRREGPRDEATVVLKPPLSNTIMNIKLHTLM